MRLTTTLLALFVSALISNPALGQTFVMDSMFPATFGDYTAEEMEAVVIARDGSVPTGDADVTFTLGTDSTGIEINVRNTVPDAYHTIWIRLPDTSPLTGAGATPLANASDIAVLAETTPDGALTQAAKDLGLVGDDGSGAIGHVNSFWTDSDGNGTFAYTLDFRFTAGANYPFDEFDPSLPAGPIGDVPFTFRVITHLDDPTGNEVGHGLVPGRHEMWFDTSEFAVPEPTSMSLACLALAAIGMFRRRGN